MFYDRLNGLCQSIGTTVTKFSVAELGVSNSTPTSWKKGTSPNSDVVKRAALFFGVSSDYLLGLTDEMRSGESLPADESELLEAWRQADQEHRRLALSVLRLDRPGKGESSSPLIETEIPAAL